MRKKLTIALFLITSFSVFSQKMTITKLDSIIKNVTTNSRWTFLINEIPMVVIADSTHNRMRILSPITEQSRLTEDLKTASLMANFHTALDIKYAIANEILWSTYIHPLKELSENQLIDAFSQVYYGNVNFGTTFSSGSLIFPGRNPNREEGDLEQEEKEQRQELIEKI